MFQVDFDWLIIIKGLIWLNLSYLEEWDLYRSVKKKKELKIYN